MKNIRYTIEALVLILFYGLCDLLPVATASSLGGFIGRHVGPRLAASRKARNHLRESMPEITDREIETHVSAMWDNLGRVIAEYPHLSDIGAHRVTISGAEHIKVSLDRNKPVIVFGAHLANWEVMAPAVYHQLGIKLGLVYRAPNNPISDRLLDYARSLRGVLKTLPKSTSGTRQLVQSLKGGESIGILIDQKYNEGVAVPFFGRPAMTSPAFVQLARKYQATLIPFQCVRHDDARFTVTFEAPLATDDADMDVMRRAHTRLESWIEQQPGQWMWLHRRWGKVSG
ncbi:MAG TPA: lysophospholipid acyltransferase family protein [Micavibrio sp.]